MKKMAKGNNKKQPSGGEKENGLSARESRIHPDTRKSIWAIALIGVAVILFLAPLGKAGPAGNFLYNALLTLLGLGYLFLPTTLTFAALMFLFSERQMMVSTTLLGAALFVLSALGFVEIISPERGGWLGLILGSLRIPFGEIAAATINVFIMIIAALVAVNLPLKIKWPAKGLHAVEQEKLPITGAEIQKTPEAKPSEKEKPNEHPVEGAGSDAAILEAEKQKPASAAKPKKFPGAENYVPPPLSLLKSSSEKPATGDLLANANVIKRTLDSFGIPVEMGEINVGPAVTRYTLKPAEGVKLSRITALSQDLALALAAHPVRIEAPIPGKSLVGVEVPNKAAALVRLGSLMGYSEFQKSGLLGFVLGRDVSGEPIFADIEKMPHLLVAGATGSGKSLLIHSLLISLLYKNSPSTLKLILIDPKRVELSTYENLPHLISPVIVESKKAIGVFKWAIGEMDWRYDALLQSGSRDIKSYNAQNATDPLPYILIVIDELADLMTSFGREVEGSIVRLAQMARATGLHLILSTQRPSVEVITGLIKANITSRVALQVASQIDSRTILDTSGAEKLLGRGDLLYVSSDLSRPKRIQGPYLGEEEIKKITDFVRGHNKVPAQEDSASFENGAGQKEDFDMFGEFNDGDDDELYDEAVRVVAEAKKASASLLQRRLKVGYARAARLLDLMEARGVIGPGDGAKPREVFL